MDSIKAKTIALLFIVIWTQSLWAQSVNKAQGHIQIQGKIANTTDTSLVLALTNFLGYKVYDLKIQKNGSFRISLPIDGMQDLSFNGNGKSITFYVQPNDTLEMFWDAINFNKTIKVTSPSISRNRDLQLNIKLFHEYSESDKTLTDNLSKMRGTADSIKYTWINDQFNNHLLSILRNTPTYSNNTKTFVYNTYYKYSNLLLANNLMSQSIPFQIKYTLSVDQKRLNPGKSLLIENFLPDSKSYENLSVSLFNDCSEYRSFIFNYVRVGVIFTKPNTGISRFRALLLYMLSPNRRDYYLGLKTIHIPQIRDWFITKVLFYSFRQDPFRVSEKMYKNFLPKCKTQIYKDTLQSYHDYLKKFKKGTPAPEFTLLDQYDRNVSLSDFKGKIVYIDFWGVGCGPCRKEIANYVPQLHEKYRGKEVVFINICIDQSQASWKKILPEIKLDGVNLIAEGWISSQVRKDYNINAIPHYFLIDKQGQIVNYNMAKPSEILNGLNSEIDDLLK